METSKKFFGYVSIIGKPNVGKSSLLNKIVDKDISITSRKQQTTIDQILGIKTLENIQIAFIDTPGITKKIKNKNINEKIIKKNIISSIYTSNIITVVIDANNFSANDKEILDRIKEHDCKKIILLNKIDMVKKKEDLLSLITLINNYIECSDIIPISVKKNINIKDFVNTASKYIPEGCHLFHYNEKSNKPENFHISEIIRESIIRFTGDEIPYKIKVIIEKISEKNEIKNIYASIMIEKRTHKKIIIGMGGSKIKQIGIISKSKIQSFLNRKINLFLWIKLDKKM